ncbi:MAG: hypothetical protein WC647_19360 [Desulfomonilaceae bacterium]|jgi:hypothetical protein
MIVKHNPYSFLTGDSPFLKTQPMELSSGRFETEVLFELHHEGVIGRPHGGIAMGLCLDAWRRCADPEYPVDVSYKFGGSGVAIGETTDFSVEHELRANGPALIAEIVKRGEKTPYLKAQITHAEADANQRLPFIKPTGGMRKLPYYRNCFVCGHHREVIGLKRRFRVHPRGESPLVTTTWGAVDNDLDRAKQFKIANDELHPAVLISIFDENSGWAGFLATKGVGFTVRMNVRLTRPVSATEPLLFMSRPAGTRGNPRKPRFYMAEGTIVSMADPGSPEPVAWGWGEWLILEELTEQIKKNLLPANDWEWIFLDNI